jgi:hypothetical protein
MVRYRFHTIIALGRYNEAMQWIKDMNEACRKAGLAESRVWGVGVGKANEIVLESDYPDMAAWERDYNGFQSNAEVMKAYRRGIGLEAPGTWPWDEFLIEAETIA